MNQTPNLPERDTDALARLRGAIEQVDRELIKLIGRRTELARQVGAVKRTAGLPAVDPDREAAVLSRVSEIAREQGAPEEGVRELFRQIIDMSRRVQLDEK